MMKSLLLIWVVTIWGSSPIWESAVGQDPPVAKGTQLNDSRFEKSGSATDTDEPSPEGLDRSSIDRLTELLSLVSDNTLQTHKREMPAYWLLIEKTRNTPFEELLSQANQKPQFHDLYTNPSKHRGELVSVTLNVRRVISYPVDLSSHPEIKTLYELWGWTEEAKAWMYCCVTSELPEGFPTSGDVVQQATIVGHFFKLQAYQPGLAAPNAKPLVAPLLLGKVRTLTGVPSHSNEPWSNWPMYLIIVIGGIFAFRMIMQITSFTRGARPRPMYRRRSLEPLDPDQLQRSLSEHDKIKENSNIPS